MGRSFPPPPLEPAIAVPAESDVFDGGLGTDTLGYEGRRRGVTADLAAAIATPGRQASATRCVGWRTSSEATATTGSSRTTRRTPCGAVPVATCSSGAPATTSSRARKDQTAHVAALATTSSGAG
jgi:hypothetical protein